jgi:hypothetical protein
MIHSFWLVYHNLLLGLFAFRSIMIEEILAAYLNYLLLKELELYFSFLRGLSLLAQQLCTCG